MRYNVIPAFPSPVIQVYVEDDTSELLGHDNFVTSYKHDTDTGKIDTFRKAPSLRVLEDYPKTKEILLNNFTSATEEILGYKKRDYAITTSWITLNKKGEGSQHHRHKNSFWSCVYYYQEEYPEGTGEITFANPNSTAFDFAFQDNDIEQYNNINALALRVKPEPNLLVMFPSYIMHQVLSNNIDTERCSLAFNTVPLGSWGDGDSYLDVSWFQ